MTAGLSTSKRIFKVFEISLIKKSNENISRAQNYPDITTLFLVMVRVVRVVMEVREVRVVRVVPQHGLEVSCTTFSSKSLNWQSVSGSLMSIKGRYRAASAAKNHPLVQKE